MFNSLSTQKTHKYHLKKPKLLYFWLKCEASPKADDVIGFAFEEASHLEQWVAVRHAI